MAQSSTLYRFKIELSDIARSVYESFGVRLAMHPSETEDYLLTRLFAYALNYEDGLSFSDGLSAPDEPSIKLLGPYGQILKWIDIGNPAARRLHKASKASPRVRVYTYKNPENLKKELSGAEVHRAQEIEIFSFEPSFLGEVAGSLKRDNTWVIIHNEAELLVTVGERSFIGALSAHRLA